MLVHVFLFCFFLLHDTLTQYHLTKSVELTPCGLMTNTAIKSEKLSRWWTATLMWHTASPPGIMGSATLKVCHKDADGWVEVTASWQQASPRNSCSDTFQCPQPHRQEQLLRTLSFLDFHVILLLASSLQTIFFFPFLVWNFVLHLPTLRPPVLLFATIF